MGEQGSTREVAVLIAERKVCRGSLVGQSVVLTLLGVCAHFRTGEREG